MCTSNHACAEQLSRTLEGRGTLPGGRPGKTLGTRTRGDASKDVSKNGAKAAAAALTRDLLHLLPAQQGHVDLEGGARGHLAAAALVAKAVCAREESGPGRRVGQLGKRVARCAASERGGHRAEPPGDCHWSSVGSGAAGRRRRATVPGPGDPCLPLPSTALPSTALPCPPLPCQPLLSHSGFTTSFTSSPFFIVLAAAHGEGEALKRRSGGAAEQLERAAAAAAAAAVRQPRGEPCTQESALRAAPAGCSPVPMAGQKRLSLRENSSPCSGEA